MSLALWLRAGRAQKGMSLESVSKVTKIQPRILERLEAGKLDGLPAEVFVRGFVRSFAKCVGLDEAEALERFTAASAAATGSPQAPSNAGAAARAFVETMSGLAPASARAASDRGAGLAAGSARDLRADAILEAEMLEAARLEQLRQDAERTELARKEAARIEADRIEVARIEAARVEAARVEAVRIETARADAERAESERIEIARAEIARVSAETEHAVAAQADGAASTGGKKKRGRRGGKGRNKRTQLATGTPSAPMPVVAASSPSASMPAVAPMGDEPVEPLVAGAEGSARISTQMPAVTADAVTAVATDAVATVTADAVIAGDEPVVMTEPWTPKMPTVVAPTVPWRRPYASLAALASAARVPVVPSLVIDDADPDSADREREERAAAKDGKEAGRRSFLPPILLDREDRTARQGGLTLAVIILLIAATLTLSYLMRRPSSSGDGVTLADEVARDILA